MERKILISGIILGSVVLVFASFSPFAGANTSNNRLLTLFSPTIVSNYTYSDIESTQNVVWDNGLDYTGCVASQWDESEDFDPIAADDFYFENNTTVTNVHWIGNYMHLEDGDFDMEIIFYYDRGDGYAPGEVYAGPFFYLNAEVNETLIEPGWWYFDYFVSLTEPIVFPGRQKFWMSIQSIGYVYPQWGWAYHESPILLYMAVWKSEYFGYTDWTDSSIIFGSPINMCFQLISESNNPPDVPEINGPSNGKPETLYDFTFNATDPDEDSIMYFVDWGDDNTEWTEYSDSGEEITLKHSWEEEGAYIIKAKAKDIHDAESEWASLTVTIPRSKAIIDSFFLQFLEKFPILSRLQCLLK